MEQLKRPTIFEANLIYLVLGLLLISVGQMVQLKEVYSGLLITEFIIILLPNLAYLKFKGYSLKKVLRLNKISFEQGIYAVFIMIFAYPFAVILNIIMISILSKFTSIIPSGIPLPSNLKEFGLGLFVMAIAPGICEEIMFRGTMLDSYSKFGYKKGIVITAFLFGIFHFNLFNFIGPIFLGLILGILAYKTNSIFTSIIGHTINNSIALTLGFFVTKYSSQLDEMANQSVDIDPAMQLIVSSIMLLVIGAGSLFMLILLIKKIPNYNYSLDVNEYEELIIEKKSNGIIDFLLVLVVIVIFLFINIKFLFT